MLYWSHFIDEKAGIHHHMTALARLRFLLGFSDARCLALSIGVKLPPRFVALIQKLNLTSV